jgi:hypothetical protein
MEVAGGVKISFSGGEEGGLHLYDVSTQIIASRSELPKSAGHYLPEKKITYRS